MEDIEKLREMVSVDATNRNTATANIFTRQSPPQKEEKSLVVDDKTDKLVDVAFQNAIVTRVNEDTQLQDKMLDTAKKFTETKMEVIKNRVDKEDKQAFFENNESACECFGYNEKDTEKWAVKYMKVWHTIMTALWITIGWVTYAPITFIARKIGVIFRKTWIAIIIAIILYIGVTLSPLWIKWIAGF